MDKESLKLLLSDLRNDAKYIKESFDFNYREEKINSLIKSFKEKADKAGFSKKEKTFEKSLKDTLNKCEKDNEFAKKEVTISRVNLIIDLLDAHDSCAKKIMEFSEKEFKEGKDLVDASNKIEGSIKKLDDLCTETFSFKDAYSMHSAASNLIKLAGIISDSDKLVETIYSSCADSVHLEDQDIKDLKEVSSDKTFDLKFSLNSASKEISLKQQHGNCVVSCLTYFESLTYRIYNKAFMMVDHFCETYK